MPTERSRSVPAIRALVADDEPLLAQALIASLHAAWPELDVIATAADGRVAVERVLALQPDVAFLDIRMPGLSGLEVAQEVAEEWADSSPQALPLFVFVTAHDEFALNAFEIAAVDYVLKPVTEARLVKTVTRLRERLASRDTIPDEPDVMAQAGDEDRTASSRSQRKLVELATALQALLAGSPDGSPMHSGEYLRAIRAGVGDTVRMIPIQDVVLFEAADKYVLVHTSGQQALIRESLRELLPRLDPVRFAQIHRGTIVNLDRVDAAVRAENGKLTLRLHGSDQRPIVSRLYRHLFQSM